MLLTDMLKLEQIKVPLAATDKQGAIQELVDLLAGQGRLLDRDKAYQAVLEREQTRTTGIGEGVAIPHGKTPAVDDLVIALGKAPDGVDFESIDGKPVTLILLLLSPSDRTGLHIQALARISRLISLDAFRKKMASAQTAEEIFQVIQQQEQSLQ
ncbi:MAG: PTS system fructose-specific EIIABC component [Planctomycetes bacterium ADurb.Bin126]|nr:MAG: PTS system fructose-specific EIIABC component [Planctomycetes bacterium ADurb.Bin126]HOD83403.1 PTS sugar transporter subunit IIA [Phycisphaerae bacterium]HQL74181.1 PTS sugar transporter subunit IIA [Phycisphaerae bacterium]